MGAPAPQTFRVTASPRERYFLARMLLNTKLKFKDRNKERALFRVRKALGLMAATDEVVNGRPVGEIWRERARGVFVMTADNADFLVSMLSGLEKDAGESYMLEELIEKIENKKDDPDAAEREPLDVDAEEPLWKHSASAIIESPAKLLELFNETLADEQSFGVWRVKMLAALKPVPPPAPEAETPEEATGDGEDLPEQAAAAS